MQLHFDPAALRPLIRVVVEEVLHQMAADQARLNGDGRLAFSEAEAASLLDLQQHVLRDERRRGKITASSIVGRRVRYLHADLMAYLLGRRYQAAEQGTNGH
jgi:hypothetical protein